MPLSKKIKKETYQKIKKDLLNLINKSPRGHFLPSEQNLIEKYQVSQGYIREILHTLELEGHISRSQGRRTRINKLIQHFNQPKFLQQTTFGIVLQEQDTNHELQILQGFNEVANSQGIQTISYNIKFDDLLEGYFLEHLNSMGISSLAIWTHGNSDQHKKSLIQLHNQHFPVVLIDRYLNGIPFDAVVSDNRTIVEKLTSTLIQKGHKYIGFIASELRSTTSIDRFDGYRLALNQAGLGNFPLYLTISPWEDMELSIIRLFSLKRPPTALVFSFDFLAYHGWRNLTKLGYSIPSDVEIATIADNDYHQKMGFPAWIMKQNSIEIGRTACNLLIQRLNSNNKPCRTIYIPPANPEPIQILYSNEES